MIQVIFSRTHIIHFIVNKDVKFSMDILTHLPKGLDPKNLGMDPPFGLPLITRSGSGLLSSSQIPMYPSNMDKSNYYIYK